jgi:hypothetical protein
MRSGFILVLGVALLLGAELTFADSIPISNSGFESGDLDPWAVPAEPSGGFTPSVDSAEAHSGSYSLRMALDKGGHHAVQDFLVDVVAGTEFELTLWALMPYAGTTTAKWLTAHISAYDTNGDYMFNVSHYQFDALTEWTEISVILVAPENLGRIEIGVHTRHGNGVTSIPEGGPVWVDDFSLESSISGGEPVPEPGTWALMGLGLLGLAYQRRRMMKAKAS